MVLRIYDEFFKNLRARWSAGDAIVSTHGHHATTLGCFGVEHVEFCLQVSGIFLRAEVARFIIDDVVHVQGIRHDRERLSSYVDYKWFIAADVVNVVDEAKLLKNLQRVWCATKPEGVKT